jgi:uncharacterized protein YcfJ
MKLSEIQTEGIGDSLKIAGKAAGALAGDFVSSVGQSGRAMASSPGVLATGFARAVGFDASQGGIGTVQKGIARQQFIGTFVSKLQGFIASTSEAFKDDIALIQKQLAQQQQAQQQGAPVQESYNYSIKLKVYLKEAQEVENFIKQYGSTIEQAITSYMSGNLGNLKSRVQAISQQIAQMIVSGKNPVYLIQQLAEEIFDQYYSQQRQEFVQSHPAADIPLSSDGQQVLAALEKLNKKEQNIVIQKLKQGGKLF